jgi:serine/threonine-protein kinase RsbW
LAIFDFDIGVTLVITLADTPSETGRLPGEVMISEESPRSILVAAEDEWNPLEVDELKTKPVGSALKWEYASFTFDYSPESVRKIRRCVRLLAKSLHFSRDEVEAIETAVGEAALNAVKHGVPPSGNGVLKVVCKNKPGAFVVEITDQGPGFDLSRIPPPVAEKLKPSGYGIALMRGLMDRVDFFRARGGGTKVRLVKRKRGAHCRRN